MSATHHATCSADGASPFPEGVFRMTTRFLEEEGFSLEGNRVCDTCFLGGAAFMLETEEGRIPSGAQWKAKKLPNGFYHLTTVFQEPEGTVLEGNKFAPSSFLGGAAFMSPDKGATGTMWKAIPAGGGYYFLTTKFLEDEDLVLEGNKVAEGSTLGGAAFMSPDKATGTQWKFIEL